MEEAEKVDQIQVEKEPRRRFVSFEDFGISEDEIQELDGYEQLSPGQKRLVFANFREAILGEARREGYTSHTRRIHETTKEDDFKRIPLFLLRGFYGRRRERDYIKHASDNDFEDQKNLIQYLIYRAREFSIEIHSDDSLFIEYIQLENPTHKEWRRIMEFNAIASRLAQTPEEWRYATATKAQRGKVEDIESAYHCARKRILPLLIKKYEDPQRAMRTLALIEHRIRVNQFFNTHPKAESQLVQITHNNPTLGALITTIKENGKYAAASLTTRAIATAIANVAAFPLVAALAGRRSARRTLTKERELARHGETNVQVAKLEVEDATTLTNKLKALKRLHEIALNTEEQKHASVLLEWHLGYAEQKINKGLVNYGGGRRCHNNFYTLLALCAEIRASMDITKYLKRAPRITASEKERILARHNLDKLEKLMKRESRATKKAHDSFVKKAGWRSLKWSAGIFTVPAMLIGPYIFPHLADKARHLIAIPSMVLDLTSERIQSIIPEANPLSPYK